VLDTKLYILGLMLLGPALVAFLIALRIGRIVDRVGQQMAIPVQASAAGGP